MALDLTVTYPGQVGVATGDYPQGVPRNVSVSGAGDGTPWEQAIVRDWAGFFQKLLKDGPIVPSGSADTANASDYLDALKLILLQRSELKPNGGNILVDGDRLARSHKDGLNLAWITGASLAVNVGSARDASDGSDIIFSSAFVKTINATWTAGTSGGGLPALLVPITQGWKRVFVVAKPDGTSDVTLDTSATAANFFVDANAIAAGFSDPSLHRRVGWVYIDAGLSMKKFHNNFDDPSRFLWDVADLDVSTTTIGTGSRTALTITHAPPNSLALLNMFIDHNADSQFLITEATQVDTAAGVSNYTARMLGSPRIANMRGTWRLDASSQLFARRTATGSVQSFEMTVDGWVDGAIVA